MKNWLHKFLLHFWPWREIDYLERSLVHAEKRVGEAYERGHVDGVRWHLERWMMASNMYYGPESFRDRQEKLMIRLYEDGLTYRQAIEYLKVAEGIGSQWMR